MLVQWSVLPSFYIPQEILLPLLLTKEKDIDEFDISLSFLIENGWIQKETEEGNSYFCHSLMQEAVRLQKKIEIELYEIIVKNLGWLIYSALNKNRYYSTFLLPYVNTLLLHIKDEILIIADLINNTIFIYEVLGDYKKQLVLPQKSFIQKKLLSL